MGKFDALYAEHGTPALRLAVLLLGHRASAEDLVAKAFGKVAPQFQYGDEFDFARKLREVLLQEFRAGLPKDRHRSVSEVPAEVDLTGLTRDPSAVATALRGVTPRERAAVVLHVHEGLPERDVGKLLDLPIGTAKATIADGLAQLRDRLAGARARG